MRATEWLYPSPHQTKKSKIRLFVFTYTQFWRPIQALQGEWRGGIAPPRSPRTGHSRVIRLPSFSRHQLSSQLPMREQLRLPNGNLTQPMLRFQPPGFQPLVLRPGPTRQCLIQIMKHLIKRRVTESAIIVDPAAQHRIAPSGQFVQRTDALAVQFPPPHRLTNLLGRRTAEGRCKADEESALPISDHARPKREAQKIERLVFGPARRAAQTSRAQQPPAICAGVDRGPTRARVANHHVAARLERAAERAFFVRAGAAGRWPQGREQSPSARRAGAVAGV